jgi:hypothetical protein
MYSIASLIYKAIDIVKKNENRFHVLLIIADGQGQTVSRKPIASR